MFKKNRKFSHKKTVPQALLLSFGSLLASSLPGYAQLGSAPSPSFGNIIYGAPGTTTLRDPLIPGASFSMPGIPAAPGMIPPIGSGAIPLPPNPGMAGLPSTLIPWASGAAGLPFSIPTNQVVAPANQINLPSNQIGLPLSNATALPPGAMNAAVVNSIPQEPSTPGAAPGMLRPPSFYNGSSAAVPAQNVNSAAAVAPVGANGQLPVGVAPITRPVRQSSRDFGLPRTANGYRLEGVGNGGAGSWVPQAGSNTTDFGLSAKKGVKKAQISYDSPLPAQYPGAAQANAMNQNASGNHTRNFANAQVTNDLYGIPMINPFKTSTSTAGVVSQGPPPPMMTIIPPPSN